MAETDFGVTPIAGRLMQAHWAIRGVVFALIGMLMATALAPFDQPVALIAGLGLAFGLFLIVGTSRRAMWMGWVLGTGYFGLGLRWIVNPFYVDAARDGWMAPFALILLAGGLALFWGAAFGFARWLGGGAGRQALALAIGWSLAELARAHLFTGFPWAGFAQGLIETPLARIASYLGADGLAVGLLLVFALFVWLADRVTAVIYPLGVAGLIGVALLPQPDAATPGDGPVVRLVQPNAPQDEKWDPDRAPVFLDRMLRATGAGAVPGLVVWPETAIPYLLEYADPVLAEVADAARGAPVVLGINRRDGARFYNTLAVVGRGGLVQSLYDKVHLVPFGEYIPYGDWLVPFGITAFAASQGGGFTAGETADLIDLPGIGKARALICYEGIFGDEVNAVTERPRLLLLITNDAWFGPDAGPLQHLAQARLRAIEQGLPMVRVANTGVSAMIDGRGAVVASLGMGQTGALDVALPAALPPTLYSRIGDWPLRLLVILAAVALIAGRARKSVDPATARP